MKALASYKAYRNADREQLAIARRIAGFSGKQLFGAVLVAGAPAMIAWLAVLATGLSLFVALLGAALALVMTAAVGAIFIYYSAEKLVGKGR